MIVSIRNPRSRLAILIAETAAFALASAWTAKSYIAERLAGEGATPDRIEEAARLDPSNAVYQLDLGRFYQYVPGEIQPDRAVSHLRHAVELNAHDPETWLDLGAALELQGQVRDAESCFHHANDLAPRLPQVQWAIANFLLLHADVDQAFAHFQVVLAGTPRYNQAIFDIAWKASGNAAQILDEVIPRELTAELAYLHYLVPLNRLTEAQAVWKRIVSAPDKFPPFESSDFIDHLIANNLPEEAFGVWTDLRKKGWMDADLPSQGDNLIVNGSFEAGIENMGFGWRAEPTNDSRIWRDSAEFHSPGFSLAVEFLGQENPYFFNVFQYVLVAPGKSYELDAYLKTKGITTDSGPRLEVRDAYNTLALYKQTDDLKEDSMGWTHQSLAFTTGPKTRLLRVGLARVPSEKLDNQISGRVWLDDVRLVPAAKP
jgi:tetratricopeptide (TPR) repeat protein